MPKDKKSDLQKQIDNRELSSHIQIQMDAEGRNIFQDEMRRRHAMSTGNRKLAILAIILLVLFVVSITVVPIGNLSLIAWRHETIMRVSSLFSLDINARARMCAFGAMALVGMAMAASGATFQGLFHNAMASPTTLGVQAGGTLGGLIYILFFLDGATLAFYTEHITQVGNSDNYIFSAWGNEILSYYDSITQFQKFGLQIWEVIGCFFGVALVVGISLIAGHGKINTLFLMLAGSIFSTVVNEIGQTVETIILYNKPEEMEDARYYLISQMLGTQSTIDSNILPPDQFLWMAIPITICLIVTFSLTGKLNVLTFGEDEARAMGVPVQAYRLIFIVLCTLLCAVVLSFCGQVSMLGFLIPHLARFMVGPDFKTLVPASALLGGITTLLIWDFCSLMNNLEGFNLYTGVVCSVLSLIFMLFYRRQRHASWT